MIEEKLEIAIPTYNRSTCLENLLSNLLKSPFVKCKITVYDNCSPDETPQICEKYEKLFPNLKIVRNKENIGGDANIMKSLETPKTCYGWVIADDDIFDFSDCDDLIEAIESEKY